jgi:hypothetical protein
MPAEVVSSMMEFHSPQDSHRPTQRWLNEPQLWQTNWERALAMDCLSSIQDENNTRTNGIWLGAKGRG